MAKASLTELLAWREQIESRIRFERIRSIRIQIAGGEQFSRGLTKLVERLDQLLYQSWPIKADIDKLIEEIEARLGVDL